MSSVKNYFNKISPAKKITGCVVLVLFVWFCFCLPSHLFLTPTSYVLEDKDNNLLSASIAEDGQWRFPYLTAIHSVKTKKGPREVATVYKKGKVVMQDYVSKIGDSNHLTYQSSGKGFTLEFSKGLKNHSIADFRAVIRDEDGDRLVANGGIECFKGVPHSS